MKLSIFRRERHALKDLVPGDTFKFVGKDDVYQIIDLTNGDFFTQPNVMLREDVVYCVDIANGKAHVHQKILDVEVVNLTVTEVVQNVAPDKPA